MMIWRKIFSIYDDMIRLRAAYADMMPAREASVFTYTILILLCHAAAMFSLICRAFMISFRAIKRRYFPDFYDIIFRLFHDIRYAALLTPYIIHAFRHDKR